MKKLAVYTFLLFVSVWALSSCSAGQVPEYTSELERLDEALEQADEYVRIKEQKIATIGNMLNSRGVSPLQQYQIYGQLYEEYKAYQFDKAKEMLEQQEVLADGVGSVPRKNDALLNKA